MNIILNINEKNISFVPNSLSWKHDAAVITFSMYTNDTNIIILQSFLATKGKLKTKIINKYKKNLPFTDTIIKKIINGMVYQVDFDGHIYNHNELTDVFIKTFNQFSFEVLERSNGGLSEYKKYCEN